jgi:dihydroneopterin aldolase
MTDVISISGLIVFAHHGVLEHEKADGQTFSVDVDLHLDVGEAAASDDLNRTISYADVADLVVQIMTVESYDLIETAAVRVAEGILENFAAEAVGVTVHKPSAPIPHEFKDVSVSVWRTQP